MPGRVRGRAVRRGLRAGSREPWPPLPLREPGRWSRRPRPPGPGPAHLWALGPGAGFLLLLGLAGRGGGAALQHAEQIKGRVEVVQGDRGVGLAAGPLHQLPQLRVERAHAAAHIVAAMPGATQVSVGPWAERSPRVPLVALPAEQSQRRGGRTRASPGHRLGDGDRSRRQGQAPRMSRRRDQLRGEACPTGKPDTLPWLGGIRALRLGSAVLRARELGHATTSTPAGGGDS